MPSTPDQAQLVVNALAEAVKLLGTRTDAEGVSIVPRADGGVDIRLIDKRLIVSLQELSTRLPGSPSVPVLKKTCNRRRVTIFKIGGKPCVSSPAFHRTMEAKQ